MKAPCERRGVLKRWELSKYKEVFCRKEKSWWIPPAPCFDILHHGEVKIRLAIRHRLKLCFCLHFTSRRGSFREQLRTDKESEKSHRRSIRWALKSEAVLRLPILAEVSLDPWESGSWRLEHLDVSVMREALKAPRRTEKWRRRLARSPYICSHLKPYKSFK